MFGHRLNGFPLGDKYKRVIKILPLFLDAMVKRIPFFARNQERVIYPDKKGNTEPKVGDVVLLVDEILPPKS